jgi:hypothetical protein
MNDGHASILSRIVRVGAQVLVVIVIVLLILHLVATHLLELSLLAGLVMAVYVGAAVRRYRRSRW